MPSLEKMGFSVADGRVTLENRERKTPERIDRAPIATHEIIKFPLGGTPVSINETPSAKKNYTDGLIDDARQLVRSATLRRRDDPAQQEQREFLAFMSTGLVKDSYTAVTPPETKIKILEHLIFTAQNLRVQEEY